MKIKLIWALLAASLVVLAVITAVSISTTHRYPRTTTAKPVIVNTVAVIAPTKPNVDEVFTLVNQERISAGLPALTRDSRLDASAAAKCADMDRLDVVAHDLSDGTTPYTFIRPEFSYYNAAGENLAWNFGTSATTVQGWMGSSGHKANILRTTYTNVGYAMCDVSAAYKNVVVQHFVGL